MEGFFSDSGLNTEINIKMPGSEIESLVSKKDISEEVHKEYVSTAIIEEDNNIIYPMLCINAQKLVSMPPYAFMGLRALIETCKVNEDEKDDTIPVYIYPHHRDIPLKIGSGSFNKLYMYLDNFVKTGINSKLKVYYFKEEGVKGVRIDKGDPRKIKLDI